MPTSSEEFIRLVEQEASFYQDITPERSKIPATDLISNRFMVDSDHVREAIGIKGLVTSFNLPPSIVHPYDDKDKIVAGVEYLITDRENVSSIPQTLIRVARSPEGIIKYQSSGGFAYAIAFFDLNRDLLTRVESEFSQESILENIREVELARGIKRLFSEINRLRGTGLRRELAPYS